MVFGSSPHPRAHPDCHEYRGENGGRLHGLCGKSDPDCDNPVQRVCHGCLDAKQSSERFRGRTQGGQAPGGKRKATYTGGRGGVMEERKVWNRKYGTKQDKSVPAYAAFEHPVGEILERLGRKASQIVITDRYGGGPQTVSKIERNKASTTKLVASASAKASSSVEPGRHYSGTACRRGGHRGGGRLDASGGPAGLRGGYATGCSRRDDGEVGRHSRQRVDRRRDLRRQRS